MNANSTYRLCPQCDFFCSKNEIDVYCSICGAKLLEKCSKCGKEITNPYANFCRYCGSNYPGRKSNSDNKKT